MTRYLLIFIASGLGGALRYWLGGKIQELSSSFPWGTLAINVSGCLAIGFLARIFAGAWPIREDYRLAILVGFLGGYTTFSTFAREALELYQAGNWTRAAAYVAATNVAGLLAVLLGTLLANKLLPSQTAP